MRILVLSNVRICDSTGSGYIISGFCESLKQRGHQVVALDPKDYELLQWFGRGSQYRLALGMLLRTIWEVARNKYDVIEFYGAEGWLTVAVLNRMPNRNFLLVLHSNGIETHVKHVFNEAMEQGWNGHKNKWYQFEQTRLFELGFQGADGIVTVSEWDKQYALIQRYQEESRIVAIENPLPDDYRNLPLSLNRNPVIGFCGNWLPRKGTEIIKSDLPRILRERKDWTFCLVGVGDAFQKEDHFPEDVWGQITIVPFANRSTLLKDLYQSFSIVVMPSIYESFGLVAAEAMACGCAVVATRTGFPAGLVDGNEIALMKGFRSPALFEKLSELIDDPRRRHRIAQNGYNRIQSLQWSWAVKRLEDTFDKWLSDKRQEIL